MAAKWFRRIFFELDRASAQKTATQMEDTLAKAGAEGGKDFVRELKRQFDMRNAEIKVALRKGLISDKEAKRLGEEAARNYNKGLLRGMDAARARGELTDREFVKLSRSLKNVGDTGTTAFGRIKTSISGMWSSGMAQLIGTGGIVLALRKAVDEANLLDASARVLAATAKITGVEFQFLEAQAQAANDRFRLGTVLSNNLTIELSKLTSKAGDITKLADGMSAFLDIGAARGLSAQQTLDAVRQSILGIDEGTDKLFGKNPSVLYKEFADRIGVAVAKLTDQQKAQAILDGALRDGEKVRGSYLEWLTSAAGQQFLLTQEIDKTFAAFGKSLQPALVAILPAFTMLAKGVGGFIEVLQDLGRYITGTLLFAYAGLMDANAGLAEGHALVLRAASAVADFLGFDKSAEKWRERADAINEEAKALRELAAASREVAMETFGEAGGAFGGPASGSGGGSTTPTSQTSPPTPTGRRRPDGLRPGISDAERFHREREEKAAADVRLAGAVRGEAQGVSWLPDPEKVEAVVDTVVAINERGALDVGTAWENAMDVIQDAVLGAEGILSRGLEAIATGGLKGLGRFVAAMSKEMYAMAAKHVAAGIGALAQPAVALLKGESAGGHFKAAAAYVAAGTAFKAMGGGGSASSGAAGRAVAAGASGNPGGRTASNAEPLPPEIHVHIDPLSTENPAAVRFVYAAGQKGDRYFGKDAVVHMHRAGER